MAETRTRAAGRKVLRLLSGLLPDPICPNCDAYDWQHEPDLLQCRRCGVLVEPAEGRWRFSLLPTRYPMPGWRGVFLFRKEVA